MLFTITEKHLDRAIKAIKKGSRRDSNCLVAQACKVVYGHRFQYCSAHEIAFKDGQFTTSSQKIEKLIRSFDHGDYDKIRKRLPLEVNFPDAA